MEGDRLKNTMNIQPEDLKWLVLDKQQNPNDVSVYVELTSPSSQLFCTPHLERKFRGKIQPQHVQGIIPMWLLQRVQIKNTSQFVFSNWQCLIQYQCYFLNSYIYITWFHSVVCMYHLSCKRRVSRYKLALLAVRILNIFNFKLALENCNIVAPTGFIPFCLFFVCSYFFLLIWKCTCTFILKYLKTWRCCCCSIFSSLNKNCCWECAHVRSNLHLKARKRKTAAKISNTLTERMGMLIWREIEGTKTSPWHRESGLRFSITLK